MNDALYGMKEVAMHFYEYFEKSLRLIFFFISAIRFQ